MIGAWGAGPDPAMLAPGATAMGRGPEHRMAALSLGALLIVGTLMGTLNLLLGGVVRPGAPSWVYGGTMLMGLVAALPLIVRQRAGRWHTFALVLLGDLMYVVVTLCVIEPAEHAGPLMLLFPAFVAAWFLGPWELGMHMLLVTVACGTAVWPSHEAIPALIQIAIDAGTLNAASLGVFVLRRRVQRLLVATQALSHLDPLTGLFNRRYLAEQAARIWRQARRDGSRVAAMVLDLDHFKQLNDAHGHAAGDAVLRAVADALSATVRPSDVLARTGGEELVVLGLVSGPEEADRLAERLRAAVAGTRTQHGHAVTTSIGFALAGPLGDEEPSDALWRLIDRADVAMYAAKQQGRDRVASLLPRARVARAEESSTEQPAIDVA